MNRASSSALLTVSSSALAQNGTPNRRKSLEANQEEAMTWQRRRRLGNALAEHVARHPEDVGLTVKDFNWIMRVIVKWPREAGDPPLPDC